MTEANSTIRPTTVEHRGLCRAVALFGSLAILLPMWPILALIWHLLDLINDDGGAAIAGPAVMLEAVALIAVLILWLGKRSLKPEKVALPAKLQRIDSVLIYLAPAFLVLLPAEVLALMKLAGGKNSSLIWIGISLWFVIFSMVFYCLYTNIVYRRSLRKRGLLALGVFLLHWILYIVMLQSISLYLTMMILGKIFYVEPWTLVFILLFVICCYLRRQYDAPNTKSV